MGGNDPRRPAEVYVMTQPATPQDDLELELLRITLLEQIGQIRCSRRLESALVILTQISLLQRGVAHVRPCG